MLPVQEAEDYGCHFFFFLNPCLFKQVLKTNNRILPKICK
jgi:hypothetical protein